MVAAVADDDLTPHLLTWLDSPEENLRAVAGAWASAKIHLTGVTWLRQVLHLAEAQDASRRIALALSGPPTHELWDLVEAEGSQVVSQYWARMSQWRIAPEAARRGAIELVAHGRPWAALDMLASCVHPSRDGSDSSFDPELVVMVLEAALASDPRHDEGVASLGYEVGLLLDYLESSEAEPQLLARYEFAFFRLLDHHRVPRALFSALAEDPGLFVDLVSKVYRGKHEVRRELDERQEAIARQAWWILNHWHALPGLQESGDVDAEHLREWVLAARLAFADSDRADIGDEQIGQVLAASPNGTDDAWPHEAVRDLLEVIGSPSMEAGIHLGVVNLRGVTTRGVFDGGEQERELAARYRDWAKQTAGTWTRTSRILRRLGEDYEREAQRADARAEVTADTE